MYFFITFVLMIPENILHTPINYLRGVGNQRAELLKTELSIYEYQDLLNLFPNRYIDRTKFYKINELQNNNTEVPLVGKIVNLRTVESAHQKGTRLVATFVDDTGAMELVWFKGLKWLRESLKINEPYVIFGKLNFFGGTFSMPHPEMDLLSEFKKAGHSSIQPVYPSTEKLAKRNITNRVMRQLVQTVFEEVGNSFAENLPVQLVRKNLLHKQKFQGQPFKNVGDAFMNFYNHHLPFPLTDAQKRVLKEIRADVGSNAQMNRLLQGDVGSGKTIVALMTMLLAVDNGCQACLMAPTEILANQHYQNISELLKETGVTVALLTGSSKTKERKMLDEQLQSGELSILIGTHALLENKVQFRNLGLAIIDEQHRFGVEQRSKLWHKNTIPPHILVMTATPIPRTYIVI